MLLVYTTKEARVHAIMRLVFKMAPEAIISRRCEKTFIAVVFKESLVTFRSLTLCRSSHFKHPTAMKTYLQPCDHYTFQ